MSTNSILLAEIEDREGTEIKRRRLGPRLVLYILLFSSVVTLIATGLQLYLEYSRDVREIDTRLAQVEQSYINSIVLSLWIMDYEQLRIQLEGIQALPDMQYLEVVSQGETLMTVGRAFSGKLLERTFPLNYRYRGDLIELGTLRVAANMEGVYRRLLDRVLLILSSQAVKTFLVTGFIFTLFQLMVTRHLQSVSAHVRSLTLGQPARPLTLNRKHADAGQQDELDDVVNALNKMSEQLVASYRQLAESEERFNLAMRGTNDGLWDWSLPTRSVYFSTRCAEILGLHPDDPGDSPEAWQVRLHPEDRQQFRQAIRAHLTGASPQFESVFRLLKEDGTVRWVWSRGQALRHPGGRVYRMVGTHRDITVQKENEAALTAAGRRLQEEQEKRAEAQRLACIGELSASIAHEIRNPLASIVNSLVLLNIDDLPDDERRGVMEIVNSETRQLQRILNDFLRFARLRTSELAEGNIIETLDDAIAALDIAIDVDDAIEVVFEPHAEGCIAVYDSDQLRQVIWNLALNGIQAMSEGGTLRIFTRPGDRVVWVHVIDNGCGIAPELLDKVARPFFTDREEGTGLGLSVINRILEQHDSRLTIESRRGVGTEVRFSLPTVDRI